MNNESEYIQFLAEARSGGRTGMGRLAVLVWERLYPFVFRMTLNRDAAEDIIQETLLTMLRRLGSLRQDDRFWPWIYRIAWSKVQDRLRHRRLQSRSETVLLRRQNEEDGSRDSNPLAVQVRAETVQQVSHAIARLNRQQRDILRLRCFDDLPYTEIAARSRISPDRARVRFHRAKKSLKDHLACGSISS